MYNNKINIFIPPLEFIIPSNRMFLMRAGFKGNNYSIDIKLRELINQIILLGSKISEPRIYFKTFKLDKPINLSIPKTFTDIVKITYFASTLGNNIDMQINEYSKKGDILKASLLNAWASEALENLNDIFDKILRREACGTIRFSPGYGEIDIRENYIILEELENPNISADKQTGIIQPIKSTVCMIGWYEEKF